VVSGCDELVGAIHRRWYG